MIDATPRGFELLGSGLWVLGSGLESGLWDIGYRIWGIGCRLFFGEKGDGLEEKGTE